MGGRRGKRCRGCFGAVAAVLSSVFWIVLAVMAALEREELDWVGVEKRLVRSGIGARGACLFSLGLIGSGAGAGAGA